MSRAHRRLWLAALAALLLLGILRGADVYRRTELHVFSAQLGPDDQTDPVPLGPGERHAYRFDLDAGDYLEIAVEQQGIDVSASLADPAGRELILADSWIGARGPEPVAIVADRAGTYQLLIRSGQENVGSYVLHVDELHPATPRDDRRAAAAALFSEAEKLRRQNDPEAIDRYQAAADLWQDTGDLVRRAVAVGLIGRVHELLREREKARDRYLQALDHFDDASESQDPVLRSPEVQIRQQKLALLFRLGRQQRLLGDLQQAKISYLQARKLARELGEEEKEVDSLNNLGLIHKTLGETSLAIEHYEQALTLLNELDEPETEAKTLRNVAQLYMSLGDLDRAEGSLQKALRLSKTAESLEAEARTLRGLGGLAHRRDHLESALQYLERALELDRELKKRGNQGTTMRDLGWIYYKLSERDGDGTRNGELAIKKYEEALEILRELDNTPAIANALTELGWVILEIRDDPDTALSHLDRALELFRQLEYRAGEASALYSSARAERRRGRRPAALSLVEEAIDIVESLRTRTDIVGFRTTYFASKQDYYELAIALLVELRKPARALEFSEARRARALRDVLEQTLSIDEENVSGDFEISPGPSSGPGALVLGDRFGALPDLDLAHIQEILDEQTILLEYSVGAEKSFLWLVTPTELEIHELPAKAVIDPLARDTHQLLVKSRGRGRRAQRELVTRKLSSILLGKVVDRLEAKRLLIVTEGALQYVPFGALPVPGSETGDLMVSRHEIVYVPSLSISSFLRRQERERRPPSLALAVIADPVFGRPDLSSLPATREEADDLLKLVQDGGTLALFGTDASRERILGGELAKYRYVHFATHGWFDRENPDLSGLVLSGVDSEGLPVDGFLGIPEIYRRLKLPVDMVALSACRTGLGEEVRGEGLVGLTQSFFYAGAARVIVSYWEVGDDATAELMKRLYRGIFGESLSPAAALHQAQLSMHRETRWHAPYYWAGFFLQGEWR